MAIIMFTIIVMMIIMVAIMISTMIVIIFINHLYQSSLSIINHQSTIVNHQSPIISMISIMSIIVVVVLLTVVVATVISPAGITSIRIITSSIIPLATMCQRCTDFSASMARGALHHTHW